MNITGAIGTNPTGNEAPAGDPDLAISYRIGSFMTHHLALDLAILSLLVVLAVLWRLQATGLPDLTWKRHAAPLVSDHSGGEA